MRKKLPENYIPSIFNYCDRWCERCHFRSRCTLGSDPQLNEIENDMENVDEEKRMEMTIDYVANQFASIHEMIKEMIEKDGGNWEAFMKDLEENPVEIKEPTIGQSAIIELAKSYGYKVFDFFKENDWTNDPAQISSKILVLPEDLELHLKTMKTAFENIQFYAFFIGAKVHRALTGKANKELYDWDDPIQNDDNGSAKIAMIAIEKSTISWLAARKIFSELEDDSLTFLANLQRIKKELEKEFPDWKAFIRPGFDTEPNAQK